MVRIADDAEQLKLLADLLIGFAPQLINLVNVTTGERENVMACNHIVLNKDFRGRPVQFEFAPELAEEIRSRTTAPPERPIRQLACCDACDRKMGALLTSNDRVRIERVHIN
jgi:hypothetical protein